MTMLAPKDEEGIVLALRRTVIACVVSALLKAVPVLQKLIKVLDGEYPILGNIFISRISGI